MGMFDDIQYNGKNYQTKDLECELSQYRIENGRLILLQSSDYSGWKDMEYHGWLYFYGDEEYKAKFTNGQMMELIRLDT